MDSALCLDDFQPLAWTCRKGQRQTQCLPFCRGVQPAASCQHRLSVAYPFPGKPTLQGDIRRSNQEATEHERLDEMIDLVCQLTCKTHILARTVSNPIPFTGFLPTDREAILNDLREAKNHLSEEQLRSYRDSIESL